MDHSPANDPENELTLSGKEVGGVRTVDEPLQFDEDSNNNAEFWELRSNCQKKDANTADKINKNNIYCTTKDNKEFSTTHQYICSEDKDEASERNIEMITSQSQQQLPQLRISSVLQDQLTRTSMISILMEEGQSSEEHSSSSKLYCQQRRWKFSDPILSPLLNWISQHHQHSIAPSPDTCSRCPELLEDEPPRPFEFVQTAAIGRWSSGRRVSYQVDPGHNIDLDTLLDEENLNDVKIAVLDINFRSQKKDAVVMWNCYSAAIYDLNEDGVVSGPEKQITLEDLAEFLKRYDVVFFKGGIIEVAFVRRFVGDDTQLINMETLGCPNYNQLIGNQSFMGITDLDEDPQTCATHRGDQFDLHCATSEVAVFGKWLLMGEEDKQLSGVIRTYQNGDPNPQKMFAFFPLRQPYVQTLLKTGYFVNGLEEVTASDYAPTSNSEDLQSNQQSTASSNIVSQGALPQCEQRKFKCNRLFIKLRRVFIQLNQQNKFGSVACWMNREHQKSLPSIKEESESEQLEVMTGLEQLQMDQVDSDKP